MKNLDASYVAGLFDGEGCVYIFFQKDRRRHILRVFITNTYLPVLIEIMNKFGGTVGKTSGGKGRKFGYSWIACSQEALNFLNRIYPYLRIKKEEVRLAINFQLKLIRKPGGDGKKLSLSNYNKRELCRKNLQNLKRRHWIYNTSQLREGLQELVLEKTREE